MTNKFGKVYCRKVSVVSGSELLTVVVQFYTRETPLYTFFYIFSKVYDAAISKHPHKNMWWNLVEFWVSDYVAVF